MLRDNFFLKLKLLIIWKSTFCPSHEMLGAGHARWFLSAVNCLTVCIHHQVTNQQIKPLAYLVQVKVPALHSTAVQRTPADNTNWRLDILQLLYALNPKVFGCTIKTCIVFAGERDLEELVQMCAGGSVYLVLSMFQIWNAVCFLRKEANYEWVCSILIL